jgi:serine/threonine protein kinase
MLETGQVIDGKYRITRLIGTGGMGAVYEGENVLIRRRVAIKVLHADGATNVDIIRRFEREAQAAGEIGNDHILEVLDIGTLPNGDRFMVMEYLDGETLAQRIERYGMLTPPQVAPIARQFLTALVSAHAAGIIHRDLKPENIFILRSKAGRSDFVKLIDFGVSKFSRPFKEGEHRMTRANAVLGTPCYMSPEQARGASETDVRSDIYSCGVILFESVTGRLPFEGESFNDLMFKIALSDAPSALTYVPTLDPDFAAMIARAVARDPGARFATAQDFADALDTWMRKNKLTDSLSVSLPDIVPARVSVNKNGDTVSLDEEMDSIALGKTGADESWARSKAETPVKPPRRRPVALMAFGGVATLAALTILVGAMVRTRPPPPATEANTGAQGKTTGAAGSLAVPPVAQGLPAAASAAEAVQALAPIPTAAASEGASTASHRKQEPPPRPASAAGGAARPPSPASTGPGTKPKPAPASSGFDLGY